MRRRLRPRLARAGLALAGGSVLAFLVVPVLTVIPMSLSSSMVFELIPTTPGFTQYQRFFASPEWMLALGRSVQVALGAMVVATLLGGPRQMMVSNLIEFSVRQVLNWPFAFALANTLLLGTLLLYAIYIRVLEGRMPRAAGFP